jgi:hypothetical protein
MRPEFAGAQPLEELPAELPEEAFKTPGPLPAAKANSDRQLPQLSNLEINLEIMSLQSARKDTRDEAARKLLTQGGPIAAVKIEDVLLNGKSLPRPFRKDLVRVLQGLSYKHMDSFSEDPVKRMLRNTALSALRRRH